MGNFQFDPVKGIMIDVEEKKGGMEGATRSVVGAASSPSSVPLIQNGKKAPDEEQKKIRVKPPVQQIPQGEGKMFTEADKKTMQVVDEKSGVPLFYISGYDLDISFNLSEIRSVADVEQCVAGIAKMFRGIIMDLAVGKRD